MWQHNLGGRRIKYQESYVFRVLGKSGKGLAEWRNPSRLFFEQDSNQLFIPDNGNHRIHVVDVVSGQVIQQYGGKEKNELYRPRAVVAHGDQVIVASTFSHRLIVFDRSTGQMLRKLGQCGKRMRPMEFEMPSDVAVNAGNQLFVCDTHNNRVLMFE